MLRPKWLLIVAVFGMFGSVLLTNGLINSQIANDATGAAQDGPDDQVPDVLSNGGPVIDLTSGRTDSLTMPARTVALTFDDGPDPTWTPQVLAVLTRHHVPGTFFMVGSRVAHYPQLARDVLTSGSEIGLHTFTHPELRQVSPTRVDQEFTATQLALAGATGQLSYLIRPPFSSEPDALDNAYYGVIKRLGGEGYVTALVDTDSNDWQRPGVAAIVDSVLPVGRTGGVVLFHDAGGDRSQTVAALDRLIPQLQAQGVRFTTVSAGAGLPAGRLRGHPDPAGDGPGHARHRRGGRVRRRGAGVEPADRRRAGAGPAGADDGDGRPARTPAAAPPASRPGGVLARTGVGDRAGLQRGAQIASTVRSLVASEHPVEVIVVDDGSGDGTADAVAALGLPGVRVIRQPNGGKPAALNAGLAAARCELVVMMDGDTIFEPSTVRHLVEPFADPRVGAVAGNARVADRRSLIGRWQHIEYVIGFNLDRRVQDTWGVITTVPGAVGAYRRRALAEVGGVSDDTLAEDTDLTIALGRAGWRVVYQPAARAWTDAPASFAQLWRQRYRWSYGVMQSLWKHRHAVVERGHPGRLGRVGLLQAGLFQIVLPLLSPLVDVYLVYGLVFLDATTTGAIWGAALLLQLLGGVVAFRLEGEPPAPARAAPAAADRLPAADVRGADPVRGLRGHRDPAALAEDPARRAVQRRPHRAGAARARHRGDDRARPDPPVPDHPGAVTGRRTAAGLLTALVLTAPAAGCATIVPPIPEAPQAIPAPVPANPAAHGTVTVEVTFYGGPDNDPPGSTDIAYPNGRHAIAGGTGSYADPVTLASDPRELPPGTLVYYPRLRKYFVMEDDCEECIERVGPQPPPARGPVVRCVGHRAAALRGRAHPGRPATAGDRPAGRPPGGPGPALRPRRQPVLGSRAMTGPGGAGHLMAPAAGSRRPRRPSPSRSRRGPGRPSRRTGNRCTRSASR